VPLRHGAHCLDEEVGLRFRFLSMRKTFSFGVTAAQRHAASRPSGPARPRSSTSRPSAWVRVSQVNARLLPGQIHATVIRSR
jgi:hypothetical protein